MKDDTISRQAAIDALKEVFNPSVTNFVKAKMAIDNLPPEQPEQSSEVQDILEYLDTVLHPIISPDHWNVYSELHDMISMLPPARPEERTEERVETHACDLIDRQAAIDAILAVTGNSSVRELYEHVQEHGLSDMWSGGVNAAIDTIIAVPSTQPEQRYTEEELRVFAHGISLSLLSKRSAQHWRYDKDTATEIEFLERLYDKVGADMKGGQG